MIDDNKRLLIFLRDSFRCQTCGQVKSSQELQLAHRIHKGRQTENAIVKFWRDEFGRDITRKHAADILDHPFNLATTCSSKCNDAQNIFFEPIPTEELLKKIKEACDGN